MEKENERTPGKIEKGVVVMYVVWVASSLMTAREVQEVCAELRNHPELIEAIEQEAKAKLVSMKEAASQTLTAS